jgi:secondary thiamine-phosphate synthase enzyme
MKVLNFQSKGYGHILDITSQVEKSIPKNFENGACSVFVIGSTASITTIEPDENLYNDFLDVLDNLAPYKYDWKHHKTWGDDNGAAHVRASLVGPGITVPIQNRKLVLGTWQAIVLIDFDTKARDRKVVVSFFEGSN